MDENVSFRYMELINMRKRAKAGEIFVEQRESGKFMFGRVILDIDRQVFKSKKAIMDESNLKEFSISYVVEAYDAVSETPEIPDRLNPVIEGIVVNPMAFKYDTWSIVGNNPITDPRLVDFQEHCSFYNGEVRFSKGEVYIKAPLKNVMLESIDTGYQLNSPLLFNLVESLMQDPADHEALLRYDFRFLKPYQRNEIYEAIGEDPNMSYYDLAMKHGFDTSRFFK